METKKIKFGVLGAANITKMALMDPAKQLHDIVEVYAIAARDKQRAINYAKKHAISKVYETYEEVIDDPEIDAIYIPLPNSLHHKWSIAAMRKGKHVLCEKPIANNEEEAKEMIRVSNETGKFIYEAFHYRHHPCIKRVKEIIISNEIGLIQSLDASFCVPIFSSNDIRYNYELGGGAMMDTGCYVINLLRYITDLEPIIDSAVPVYCKQLPHSPFGSIDQSIHGTCHFDRILHRHDNDNNNNNNDGDDNDDSKKEGGQIEEEKQPITATFKTSLFSIIPSVSLRVKGKEGEIDVTNWVAPQFYHKITIFNKKTNKKRSEKVSGLFANDTTYFYQLRTFTQYLKQLRGDDDVKDLVITLPFPPEDSILNMIAIGNIYKKAGMPIRGEPFPVPEVRDAPNDSLDDDNDEINSHQITDVENSNIIHSENDQPNASGVEIESDIKVEDQNDKKEIEIKEISNAENDANIEAKIDEINSSELSQKEELDHEMEKETI